MKYARILPSILALFFSIELNASEIPWVESNTTSSGIQWVEVRTEYSNVSFVRRSTLASILQNLNPQRVDSSPVPVVAATLAQIDPLDKSLNIGLWISNCSLDELDK